MESMRQDEKANIEGRGESGLRIFGAVEEDSIGNADSKECSQPPGAPENETGQIVVDFDGPNDSMNPLNWTPMYKWTLVIVLSMFTFIANLTIIIVAPAAPEILSEFGINPRLSIDTSIIVCVMSFGQMLGPLLIAPLSEIYGRLPVYHTANIFFIIFTIAGGFSTNLGMVLAFRLLAGLMIVSPFLNPPIAGDLFVQEERGKAISIMAFSPLIGTVLGPVIGGYLTQGIGWRWNFWIVALIAGAFEIALLALLRETYRPQILKRKAAQSRKHPDNRFEAKNGNTAGLLYDFARCLLRPARMLVFSPVVSLVSIYVALVYGYIYLIATTLTEVFESIYHFAEGPVGLTYLGISLGQIAGVVFCGSTMDRYMRAKKTQGKVMKPEYRLIPMIAGGVLTPLGLFIYGWTAEKRVQWMVPIIGTSLFSFGVSVCQIVSASYLVDAYGVHAASAVAATMILRYMASGSLPLAGPPMYNTLGLGWGNSVLGFVALIMVPAPLLLLIYGERVRSWENQRR